MKFLNLDAVANAFNQHINFDETIADLKIVESYILSQLPDDLKVAYELLIQALEKCSFTLFKDALEYASADDTCLFHHIQFDDIEEDLLAKLSDESNLTKLEELNDLIETFNGPEQGSEFILASHFSAFIETEEVEADSISKHLADFMNWDGYAEYLKNSRFYISVKINAPNLLKIYDEEYLVRG